MIILDTGALVALFNREDPYHSMALKAFSSIKEKLITTYPVVTETCYMLARFSRVAGQKTQKQFLLSLAQEVIEIFLLENHHLSRMIVLMDQYADLPMDLADASLVVLAENLNHGRILTVDQRDFYTYRWKNTQPFENLFIQ